MDFNEQIACYFSLALDYLTGERGSQADVVRTTGLSASFVSQVAKGNKPGGEGDRRMIASALGWKYEAMINLGCLLCTDHSPLEWSIFRPLTAKSEIVAYAWVKKEEVDSDVSSVIRIMNPLLIDDLSKKREGVVPPEIASTRDDLGNFTLVPKYSTRLSGESVEQENFEQAETRLAFRKSFLTSKGKPDEMVLFEIEGESMEPFLHHGDVVLVDRSHTDPFDIVQERTYAFREGRRVMVKRLLWQNRQLLAKSENVEYGQYPLDLEDGFELIGKVIWVGHEVT